MTSTASTASLSPPRSASATLGQSLRRWRPGTSAGRCASWFVYLQQGGEGPAGADRVRPPQRVVDGPLRLKAHALVDGRVDVRRVNRVGGGVGAEAVGGAVHA